MLEMICDGAAAVLIFLVYLMVPAVFLLLVFYRPKRRVDKQESRGFDVILTPGMTPGPIEKKEDNHG